MKNQGIEPEIVRWTAYMLKNRIATATLNMKTVIKIILEGTPQGGILSVLLWNLVMNDLLIRYPRIHPTTTNVFADDSADLAIGSDENTLVDCIQADLGVKEKWADDHKLSFSADKTKAMMITKRKNVNLKPMFLKGKEIEWVDSIRYLGVILDNKLSWRQHIKKSTEKATIAMAQCRKMVGKTWGLNPKVCKWLYTAIVRPIVSYGGIVFSKCLENKGTIKILSKLQRKGLVSTLNAPRSAPTQGLELMMGILPLHIHIQTTIIMTKTRLEASGNWMLKTGELPNKITHSKTIEKWCDQIPAIKMPRDKLQNKVHMQKLFQTEILHRDALKEKNIAFNPRNPDVIHCFTDGSKDDRSSGSGYIIIGTDIKEQGYLNLGPHSTVFQTEIVALIKSTRVLLNRNTSQKRIEFYSDSQASIKALEKYETSSKCVLECKELLNNLAKENIIKINWIPGHEGYKGNEIADRLANIGTNQETVRELFKPIIPVATSVTKAYVTKWANRKHQERWTSHTECRQTKIFLPSVGKNVWNSISNMSRREIRLMVQILTGHAHLNYHLNIQKLVETPKCEQCDEDIDETAAHLIGDCPYYSRIRNDIFGSYFLTDSDLKNINISKILNFIRNSRRFEARTEDTDTPE